jgi:hypothetical protein
MYLVASKSGGRPTMAYMLPAKVSGWRVPARLVLFSVLPGTPVRTGEAAGLLRSRRRANPDGRVTLV